MAKYTGDDMADATDPQTTGDIQQDQAGATGQPDRDMGQDPGLADPNLQTGDQDHGATGQGGSSDDSLTDREKAFRTRAEDERSKRQQLEADMTQLRNQVQMLQGMMGAGAGHGYGQQQYGQQNQGQQATKEERYRQFLAQRGIDPDGYLTPLQQASLMEEFVNASSSQIRAETFQQVTPDYQGMVGQWNQFAGQYQTPDGAPSPLQRALNRSPYLRQALQNNPNAAVAAYQAAKDQIQLEQYQNQFSQAQDQDRRAQNRAQTQPLPGVAAGGGGALNQAAQIGQMSIESPEWSDYDRRVRAGEFDQT